MQRGESKVLRVVGVKENLDLNWNCSILNVKTLL